MNEYFIGKTIEEAKEVAALNFGVPAEKITFEIVEEPKKSLFGKIKGEAKVLATYNPSIIDIACEYIKKMFIGLGIADVTTTVTEEETSAMIEIGGTDVENIIGKKGEVLDSIQYLASLVANRGNKDYFRISLDCKGFRARREKQLVALAEKITKNVVKSGRSSTLEPMNPFERRIIHSVVSEIEGAKSHSVGDEPYRKVVITSLNRRPPRKNGGQHHGNGGNHRNNNDRNNNHNNNKRPPYKKKEFDISTSFEKDYKKPRPEDNIGSGLYSKIEF